MVTEERKVPGPASLLYQVRLLMRELSRIDSDWRVSVLSHFHLFVTRRQQ